MKILSAENQRKADSATIAQEPISSIDLMERASARWLEHARPFLRYRKVLVLAGYGNNGGDGLAVARFLSSAKYTVDILLFKLDNGLSKDCQINFERLPNNIPIRVIENLAAYTCTKQDFEKTVVIDAIFGSGLSRTLASHYVELIKNINAQNGFCLALDIPTGLFSDKANTSENAVLRCEETITFQSPKLSFLFPENYKYVGNFTIVNIDHNQAFIDSLICENYFLEEADITSILKPRRKFDHKGTFGHAAILAAKQNTSGAAIMAAQAAFLAGAGLTSILSNNEERLDIPAFIMEKNLFSENLNQYTLCVGPGLGTDDEAYKKLNYCLGLAKKPLVVDADAINLMSLNPELLAKTPKMSILTPHPKELERLIGEAKNSFEQLEKAKKFAQKHQIILLIKRAHTVIIDQNGMAYFNSTGNPGLSKAGSGDVLAGMITAFLAQGYSPIDSAKIAVYVHGYASDLLRYQTSYFSFTPTDLLGFIGKALQRLVG